MRTDLDSEVLSWHAHVYFEPGPARARAEGVREVIAARFKVQMGRWHELPVGPHSAAMYQVAFSPELFAELVPWLMLNRNGLNVLVHPNTLAPRADHLEHALWLGTPLPILGDKLPERILREEESPVVPNT